MRITAKSILHSRNKTLFSLTSVKATPVSRLEIISTRSSRPPVRSIFARSQFSMRVSRKRSCWAFGSESVTLRQRHLSTRTGCPRGLRSEGRVVFDAIASRASPDESCSSKALRQQFHLNVGRDAALSFSRRLHKTSLSNPAGAASQVRFRPRRRWNRPRARRACPLPSAHTRQMRPELLKYPHNVILET